jgi:hypothetical protein
MRPAHIEDFLVKHHKGAWFNWTNSKNKIYANLRLTNVMGVGGELVANPHSLPTEQECIDGLAQLQTDFDNAKTKQETDKTNANQKLKDLGLTDDEIKAIKGIS